MPRPAPLDRLVLPSLLVANVALAIGPWTVRLAETRGGVGPLGSAFWRLALALPVLAALLAARRPALPPRWPALAGGAALAGLFFAADLAAWHLGIMRTRLANATLLGNATALLFPLHGFLAARHWPLPRHSAALALATAGAVVLLGRSYELSARNLGGDLLSVAAGICYTAYFVSIARVRERIGPLATLTIAVAAGAPALLLAALATGDALWPAGWAPLVLLTLGSQLVGQGLLTFAVGRASPLLLGLMLLTQPVIAATIGWLAYGERLTPPDLLGAAAIAAALVLVRQPAEPVQAAA